MSDDYKTKGYASRSEMRRVEHMKQAEQADQPQAPREWWIRLRANDIQNVPTYEAILEGDPYIHVVEYAELERVKAEIERLRAALEEASRHAAYLEHMEKRYREVSSEKVSWDKIMPAITRIKKVLTGI